MKQGFIVRLLSDFNISKFYRFLFLFFVSLVLSFSLYISLTPTKIYAQCQCAYPETCTAADGTVGRRTCWGIISGSSCVHDQSGTKCNPSPLCDTCESLTTSNCTCTYSEGGSFCSSAGSGAIHYCWGNDLGTGNCGYVSTSGCSPGCSACLIVATSTPPPGSTPTPPCLADYLDCTSGAQCCSGSCRGTPGTCSPATAPPTVTLPPAQAGSTQVDIRAPANTVQGNITPNNIVQFIFNVLVAIGIIAALAYLLYGGIKWITSAGDKAAVEAARSHIVAAIIGLVILILAFVIVNLVLSILLGRSLPASISIPSLTG